jgi:2-polyprenyl-6-methoxyphenol hydroxylase-like FAD-dependent oxidoreductase
MSATSRFDAIVVGGGPAGATAALLLARSGWRVAVVEKASFPRRKVCGEFVSATTWPLLEALGVGDELAREAGPFVRRVGVFAGPSVVTAPMPSDGSAIAGGRAVSREVLDAVLLRRAAACGATIWQPWTVTAFAAGAGGYACTIENRERGERSVLEAPVIVAAHGSWEHGPLPTQPLRRAAAGSDLLGFKARFTGAALDADLMPLIAFPGGYGGMVNTGAGRTSLSCCIRRDRLDAARERFPGRTAGEAVLAHIVEHCDGVSRALANAVCDGQWLGAGPIRPGIADFGRDGVFAIGNAAAEAHPVVAEGISIAIQSATLLAETLGRFSPDASAPAALAAAHSTYESRWRHNFAARLQVSALYGQLFMRPLPTRLAMASMKVFPSLLRIGAAWSGKSRRLRIRGRPFASTILSIGDDA